MTHILTDADFEEKVLKSKDAVLVDFFAVWCGPCQMLAPTIDKLSQEVGAGAQVFKVDVDTAPDLASAYGIMSIPAIKLFKNGKVVEEVVGVKSKDDLMKMIDKHRG